MCRIAGAVNVPNASQVVFRMLQQLQHGGQEAAGIISSDGTAELHEHRGHGLVDEVFRYTNFAKDLPGASAIGHVLYSTTSGQGKLQNVQPLCAKVRRVWTAIAHNGDISAYDDGRIFPEGVPQWTSSDTESILVLASQGQHFAPSLEEALLKLQHAYSIVVLRPEGLYAARDALGVRPLAVARCGDGYVFASESGAFDILRGDNNDGPCGCLTDIGEVEPGELLFVERGGSMRRQKFAVALSEEGEPRTGICCFDSAVYFSRPDAVMNGRSAGKQRDELGYELGLAYMEEGPGRTIEADVVVPVPDSSILHAVGFARATGLRLEFALVRNHYAGRTFLTPREDMRLEQVLMKLNLIPGLIEGLSVILVDDSLIRGTVSGKLIKLFRQRGVREVHLAIASAPWLERCTMGIATRQDKELFARRVPEEANRAAALGADSLFHLSESRMRKLLGDTQCKKYCTNCMGGKHPAQGVRFCRPQ